MRSPVQLRADYDAPDLRALAKASRDANQTRRLLALAAIYDGASRREAAEIGGVGVQTVRDWVLAFNAAGPPGLLDGKAPGNQPLLNPAQREALRRIIEAGPNPAVDGVVRWRLIDLAQWVYAEFRISISKQTLSRMLRAMGYRKLSARPRHHAQDPAALEAFKKTSPRVWRRSRTMRPQASRSRCGLPTRRASDRRTRSPGAGPNAAPGLWRHAISAPPQPISSARSVPERAKAQPSFCHAATPQR
jgi:transposase